MAAVTRGKVNVSAVTAGIFILLALMLDITGLWSVYSARSAATVTGDAGGTRHRPRPRRTIGPLRQESRIPQQMAAAGRRDRCHRWPGRGHLHPGVEIHRPFPAGLSGRLPRPYPPDRRWQAGLVRLSATVGDPARDDGRCVGGGV